MSIHAKRKIATVHAIKPAQWWCCDYCKKRSIYYGAGASFSDERAGLPLAWLKKIDPLQDPEHIVTDEEIPA